MMTQIADLQHKNSISSFI